MDLAVFLEHLAILVNQDQLVQLVQSVILANLDQTVLPVDLDLLAP